MSASFGAIRNTQEFTLDWCLLAFLSGAILDTHHFLRGPGHEQRTTKDFVRNFQQILQNEPNFTHFSPENEDSAKKRTQIFNPNV